MSLELSTVCLVCVWCVCRRGEDIRNIMWAQCFVAEALHAVGPAPCPSIAFTLYDTKESDIETLIGVVRNAEIKHCAIAALSFYTVYMEDIYGLQLLDTMSWVSCEQPSNVAHCFGCRLSLRLLSCIQRVSCI